MIKHVGDKNNLLEFVCGAVMSVVVANAGFTDGDVVELFTMFGLLFIGSGLTFALGKFEISVRSDNVSHDDVVVLLFLKKSKLHISFPGGFSFLLPLVDASLDESPDDEPSEPLSLELSLFLK